RDDERARRRAPVHRGPRRRAQRRRRAEPSGGRRLLRRAQEGVAADVAVVPGGPDRSKGLTVAIEGGTIAGGADRGGRVFRGIPYAAPPVGPLRWKPPDRVLPWSGTLEASSHGAECPQTQYAPGSIYIRPIQKQSEDCLFVNVWTP